MEKKYFGTDGIRGTINSQNINGDMFFKFGLASGKYFKSQKSHHHLKWQWLNVKLFKLQILKLYYEERQVLLGLRFAMLPEDSCHS